MVNRKNFNQTQANINAKAAANARVAAAKAIFEEDKFAEEQKQARLKRNINAMAYEPGSTNLGMTCSPCESQIVAKLDILLDRSKPSNALVSGKKTVQSALDAVLLGLNEAAAAGKAGLGVAGLAVLVGAIRLGKAAASAAQKVGGAAGMAAAAAAVELETAARKARNCIKGSPTGVNRSVRCAAVYAAVQNAANNLKSLMSSLPVLAWSPSIPFPKFNYFTLRNTTGKSQFNRNVNRARGVVGRFGTRVATGLGAFGARVKNVTSRAAAAVRATAGKGAGAVSRAMYRLSGREQADMIRQLILDSQALKDQGRLTGKAVAELQAAMAAAQPGVVTADVKAEAAKISPEILNVPGTPLSNNGNIGSGSTKPSNYGITTGGKSRKNSRKNRKNSRKESRKNRKNSRKESRKNRKESRKNRKNSRKDSRKN